MEQKSINWEEYSDVSKLNIANKQLKSLKGISKCRNLTWLDVSGNSLNSLQWIKKLKSLNVLKASNNNITAVNHLSNLTDLKALILNNNKLTSLQGIENLVHLNALVLSHNELEAIDVSGLVHLSKLSLSHNRLVNMPNLQDIIDLKELRFNDNKIKTLSDSLANCKRLKLIDLGNNKISDFKFLDILSKIPLENLNLKGNDICHHEDYRQKILKAVKSLKILDGRRLEADESFNVAKRTRTDGREESNKAESSRDGNNSGSLENINQSETKNLNVQSEKKSRKSGGFVSKILQEQKMSESVKQVEKRTKKKHDKNQKKSKKTEAELVEVFSDQEKDAEVTKKAKSKTRKRKAERSEYDEKGEVENNQEHGISNELNKKRQKKLKKIENDQIGPVEVKLTGFQDESVTPEATLEARDRVAGEIENETRNTDRNLSTKNKDVNIEAICKSEKGNREKSNKMDTDRINKDDKLRSKKSEKKIRGKKNKKEKEINSRSGVVAVELLKPKRSKLSKSRERVLQLTSNQSQEHLFGTGEASSW